MLIILQAMFILYTDVQILQAHISWKQCTKLPINFCNRKIVVIDGNVYCGGGLSDENEFIVYCYNTPQDVWTSLLPLPVKWFGLGQVNGQLVAIGGKKENDLITSNDVYVYDGPSQMWEPTIPPMPTARDSPGVLSLPSMLVRSGWWRWRNFGIYSCSRNLQIRCITVVRN